MEQQCCKFLQKFTDTLRKKFLDYKMQDTRNFDNPQPINSFVLHRNVKIIPFSDKIKPLRNGPFKFNNNPTDVTHKKLTQERKTLYTRRKKLFP